MPSGTGLGVPVDLSSTGSPSSLTCLTSASSGVDAGLRREADLLTVPAEQADEAADLDERLPAVVHRPDRLGRAPGPVVEHLSAAPACTTITDTECAITSWSSRAIRARSSATARTRSVSSRSALRASSSACVSRPRIARPTSHGATTRTLMNRTSVGLVPVPDEQELDSERAPQRDERECGPRAPRRSSLYTATP